jgi:hypothetical protein
LWLLASTGSVRKKKKRRGKGGGGGNNTNKCEKCTSILKRVEGEAPHFDEPIQIRLQYKRKGGREGDEARKEGREGMGGGTIHVPPPTIKPMSQPTAQGSRLGTFFSAMSSMDISRKWRRGWR